MKVEGDVSMSMSASLGAAEAVRYADFVNSIAVLGEFSSCNARGLRVTFRVLLLLHGEPDVTRLILVRSISSRHNLTDTSFFSECSYSIHGEVVNARALVVARGCWGRATSTEKNGG